MPRVIIVHTLEHALAALGAASALNMPVTLQSGPDAIFYAGSLYLLRMFEQAKLAYPGMDAHFILDCADAGAEAVAAIQMGHKHIRSSAAETMQATLADIAGQYGAQVKHGDYEALDLRHAYDAPAACRQWLQKSM